VKLTPKQYDHLASVFKEAAAIILGGFVVGRIIIGQPLGLYIVFGVGLYIVFILISLALTKKGKDND